MLANAQLQMFATNIFLIFGAVLLLSAASVVVVALWTGTKIAIWHLRRRRAEREYRERRLREDGGRYPPFVEGVYERCGRGDLKVYHPEGQVGMCRVCYDVFWQAEEASDYDDAHLASEIAEPVPAS